jgi:hypothetical protein
MCSHITDIVRQYDKTVIFEDSCSYSRISGKYICHVDTKTFQSPTMSIYRNTGVSFHRNLGIRYVGLESGYGFERVMRET